MDLIDVLQRLPRLGCAEEAMYDVRDQVALVALVALVWLVLVAAGVCAGSHNC